MLVLVGESYKFCFDARAIARTYALYGSVVQRRILKSFTQSVVNFFAGVCNVATALFQEMLVVVVHVRERNYGFVAALFLKLRKIYGTTVDSYGGSCLHAVVGETEFCEVLCKTNCCGFRDSSAFEVAMPYVHQTVKESAGGEDYCFCVNFYSEVGFYSADAIIFHNYLIYSILQK